MILALTLLIREYLIRSKAYNELNNLNDRELHDIGITRSDIQNIVRKG